MDGLGAEARKASRGPQPRVGRHDMVALVGPAGASHSPAPQRVENVSSVAEAHDVDLSKQRILSTSQQLGSIWPIPDPKIKIGEARRRVKDGGLLRRLGAERRRLEEFCHLRLVHIFVVPRIRARDGVGERRVDEYAWCHRQPLLRFLSQEISDKQGLAERGVKERPPGPGPPPR